MIRILVVDDSVVMRRIISKALEEEPLITIAGTAPNGAIGLKKIEQLNPDLVLMDVEMPEMDGLTALKWIKKTWPDLPVIMFSSLTGDGADTTLEALELGASDFAEKPSGARGLDESKALISSTLVPKIKAISRREKTTSSSQRYPPRPAPAARPALNRVVRIDVLAIGVSTGGPNALARLMPSIPADFPVPIVIVQHMPPLFTKNLAARLDQVSLISVQEGADGDVIKPGGAWLAPGGFHMVVEKSGSEVRLATNLEPPEEGCRPAVDVLFRSVADVYGANTLAVILTGMGKDGLAGSRQIIEKGGRLLAQDEASSVVWGMPGSVAKAGLPEKIVPLDQMGFEIVSRVKNTQPMLLSNSAG